MKNFIVTDAAAIEAMLSGEQTAAAPAAAPAQSRAPAAGGDRVTGFVQEYLPLAEKVGEQLGVEPHVLLGQWGLETGWGKSVIPGTNNLGNIKDFRGGGVEAYDKVEGSRDKYRQYASADAFGEDFSRLIGSLGRYRGALGAGGDAEAYFAELKRGGYATDQDYVAKGTKAAEMARAAMGSAAPRAQQDNDIPTRFYVAESTGQAPSGQERGVTDMVTDMGKAVYGGVKTLARNVMAAGNAALGNLSDVELAAEAQRAAAEEGPEAKQSLMEEIQRRKEANPDAGILSAAYDTLSAAWGNKEGAAQLIAEQLPNTAVILGGAKAGGAAGAAVGSALGPLGAVAGGTLGAIAGMFLGNMAIETGAKSIEKAGDGFTEQDRQDALREGASKAGVITAVDALTFKAGSAASRFIGRDAIKAGARAEAKVLADAGVDISSGAKIAAAINSNPTLRQAAAEAGQKAALAVSTATQRAAATGAGLTMETIGEGLGEGLGEYVATGEYDPYDVAIEALSSLSQSGIQAVVSSSGAPSNELDVRGILKAQADAGGPLSKAALKAVDAMPQQPGSTDSDIETPAYMRAGLEQDAFAPREMTPTDVAGRQWQAMANDQGPGLEAQRAQELAQAAGQQWQDIAPPAPADALQAQRAAEEAGQAWVGGLQDEAAAEAGPTSSLSDAPPAEIRPANLNRITNLDYGTSERELYRAAVRKGFDTIETRGNESWLVNPNTGAGAKLPSPGSVLRARKAVADYVRERADGAATSPRNDLQQPTDAQKKAGNYAKGHLRLNGFDIAIENPRDSVRSGTAPDGTRWESKMASDYGYIKRTTGADKDQVDVFVGPRPDAKTIFVVDQVDPETGLFDESKALFGFRSALEAREGYLANYEPGWQGLGSMVEMTPDQFREWVNSGNAKLPASDFVAGARRVMRPSRVRVNTQAEADAVQRLSAEIGMPVQLADNGREETRALNALLDAWANLTGRRGIAVTTEAVAADGASVRSDGGFDGVQLGDNFFVNIDRPQMHVAQTIAHEFKHLTERSPAMAALYDRIWSMISEQGRREFYDNYLAKSTPGMTPSYDQMLAGLEANDPQARKDFDRLRSEMVADFFGQRFNDREWLQKLAKQKPALFGNFVRDWLRVLNSLLGRLKALAGQPELSIQQKKNIDQYIEQLEEAKAIAAEVAAEWAQRNAGLANRTGIDQSGALMSARDESFEFPDIDEGFLDDEMEAMLQAELESEMEGSNAPISADSIDPKDLKRAGIMAEQAFGELYWEDVSGDGWQLQASIPDLYRQGKVAKLTVEQTVDGVWRADDLIGTWVGPAAAENEGFATEQGAKDFVTRQVAAVALSRAKFDIASAVPKAKLDKIVKAWKSIGELAPGSESGAFKFGRANAKAQTLKEIAEGMGITKNYDLNVAIDTMDPTSTVYNMTFTHKVSGKRYGAMAELHKQGGQKFFTINTIELGRSGMGAAVYQLVADFAARRGVVVRPESSLSGVNTYRRTEQMISAALRTGKSNAMVPHPTQRIHGFDEKASTQADHDRNLGRMLLAALRNVRELAPESEELVYYPEADAFTFLDGEDAAPLVEEILSRTDARAFGLGRTQLARAVMTQQFLQGDAAPDVSDLQTPVLYSARLADEMERQSVIDQYKGTDQWLKAPNGLATKLTERQWVQVRTPSFKRWFGDWEAFATREGGVWNDADGAVSKAVDPQTGEPLVLYHGTSKGGFFRFNGATGTRRGELGIFMTPDYGMAQSYVRRGRARDIPRPTDRADLEEVGYQFEEQEDGSVRLFDIDGYEVDTFESEAAAVSAAIREFPGVDDVPTIYELFANIRNVGAEEDFKGAMWNGDFEGDKYEVYDSQGDIASLDDGRDVMSYDEAQELAERIGGTFEPASPLPFNTDGVAREALQSKSDGAIMRNVIDDGGGGGGYFGDPTDVFVVFDAKNVKSAVFNSGEFDDSDDIRFSRKEQDPAVGDKTDVSKLPDGVAIPDSVAQGSLEKSFAMAAGKTYARGRDLKGDLQDAVRRAAKAAGVDLTAKTKSTHRFLADMVVADARYALQSNANAVGWYDSKVSRAIGALAQIHPEIETDPEARLAFLWALAVTSNGVKVDKNFDLAETAYRTWRETGRMPDNIGIGNAATAINNGLRMHQEMVDKLGAERLMKFMSTELTVGQIDRMFGIKPGGEWTSTPVRGASILGPKIGNGFFSNLNGYFGALTMDRWLMRTWGRMTGTLIEVDAADVGAKQRELIDSINKLTDAERRRMAEIIGAPVRKNMTRAQADQVAIAAQKASMKTEKREVMMANERLDEFRKKSNNLQRALDGQKEAPSGPAERNWIRAVFDAALSKLQNSGLNMTMSDLQALLWYPERRLYDAAKADDSVSEGYEDDEAPDYANAAFKLAVDAGKDPVVVLKAMDRAERKGTVKGKPLTAAEIEAMAKEFRAAPKQQMQLAFEVAPDPADANLVAEWVKLPEADRRSITEAVYKEAMPDLSEIAGVQLKKVVSATGGFAGFVNPNVLAEYAKKDATIEQARSMAALIGFVLDQDSVALVDPRAASENGLIRVTFSGNVDKKINEIFDAIRAEVPEVDAFTLRGKNLDILNFTSLGDGDLEARIADALSSVDAGDITFVTSHGKSRSELIEKDSYERHIDGIRPGSGSEIRSGAERLRDRARRAVADGIREARTRNAARPGRAAAARLAKRPVAGEQGPGPGKARLSARLPGELFYSELKRQIDGASMRQAAPGAWKAFIKGLTGKGVKADEIEWTGINDWLDLQEGKVSKAAISQYLEANGVQLSEVTYRESNSFTVREAGVEGSKSFPSQEAAQAYIDRRVTSAVAEMRDSDWTDNQLEDAYNQENDRFIMYEPGEGPDVTQFDRWTLPGGKNYREVLLKLPSNRGAQVLPDVERVISELPNGVIRALPQQALEPFADSLAEKFDLPRDQMLLGIRIARGEDVGFGKDPYLTPSHWGNEENIVAHIRLKDRTTADGRKILFVEELQSDWGQDKRKQELDVQKAVDNDFQAIVDRMVKAGVLQVDCD